MQMKKMFMISMLLFPNISYAQTVRNICVFLSYHSQVELEMQSDDILVFTFVFDTLTKDAFIEGNLGLSPVTRISGSDGQTFLEVLATGSVQSTTISNDGAAVWTCPRLVANT